MPAGPTPVSAGGPGAASPTAHRRDGQPLLSAAQRRQELRCRCRRWSASTSTSRRAGDRPGRRQRRRKSTLIKTISGIWQPDGGPDPLGGSARPDPTSQGRRRPRDRHRVPGSRPLRQPRHRPEHVPGPRAAPPSAPRRDHHGAGGQADPGRSVGHHRPLDPPAGRLALRRPAPVGGGGPGRDAERQAGDHGRADRRPGRRADRDGARI